MLLQTNIKNVQPNRRNENEYKMIKGSLLSKKEENNRKRKQDYIHFIPIVDVNHDFYFVYVFSQYFVLSRLCAVCLSVSPLFSSLLSLCALCMHNENQLE